MTPLVSIIIPVYNVKDFLRESIDSAIRQTYRNLEIIVVDDGATDGSGLICDEYQSKDPRIHVIHQANQGLSGARNTGLDYMHGSIVAFLDSDDAFLPEMVETMVKAMLETGADIAACGFYSCKTTGRMDASQSHKTVRFKPCVISSQTALRYLIDDRLSINVWNKLYKKEVFETLRFPVRRNHEDLILTPYLTEKAKKVVLLEEPFVLYRTRAQSISTSVNEKNIGDWLYAARQWEAFAKKRTPPVFSHHDLSRIRETNLRWVLGKKLLMLSQKDRDLSESLRAADDAIRHYSKHISKVSPKIKIYSALVQKMPKTTYRAIVSYHTVRKTRERVKAVLAGKRKAQ